MLIFMDLKERINLFLEHKKINRSAFEKASGLSNGYTRNIKESIGGTKLEGILNAFPELNRVWLLTGEGEMLVDDRNDISAQEVSFTNGVPYFDESFECGFDELTPSNVYNPDYLIRMPGYEKATLWCNATGHSMEPEISNGDIIALQLIEDPSFLPFGDVYGIITTNGMRTVKRLGRSSREGFYRLIPTNKEYDEQEIPIRMISVVYRVMGAMKPF